MNIPSLNELIQSAIETQTVDMTQESTGGAGLMPEGYAVARMCTYIELGKQPQEYQGKAKAPADEVRIGFRLYGGPENCYDGRFISTFDLALSNNTKAGAKKLFERLNWDKSLVHIAQALGKAFLVKIEIHQNATTKKESNRLNIDGILPPIEPVSRQPFQVPELEEKELTYFFFDHPTKETWDSLFVDGKWDDGKSKNTIQEKIMTALNFQGSVVEQMIAGIVLPDLQTTTTATAPVTQAAPVVAPVVAPAAPVVAPSMANIVVPQAPKV